MSNPLDFDPTWSTVWGSSEPPESLRDRFAMAALTGIMASKRSMNCSWDEIAVDCYGFADAMMAQRLKPPAANE